MSYSTLEGLKKRSISEEELIQLTDDEGLGDVNAERVTDAINAAADLIEPHLRGGGYTLPLETVPGIVTKISDDLTVYFLHQRRLKTNMPESMENIYKKCLKLLGQIQSGMLSLGVGATSTPASGGNFKTNKTSDDRTFPKTTLDGF